MTRMRWTRELAILALRREAERIGRTPGQLVLRKPECIAAPEKVYRRLFGSMRNAQIAAGLKPNERGRALGWRKAKCKRGHDRTPNNVGTQGHCRLCAAHWASRQGRGVMLPRRKKVAVPKLDPRRVARINAEKAAFWRITMDAPRRASYPRSAA